MPKHLTKDYASYSVFEAKSGTPLGTIDTKKSRSARSDALSSAKAYERETGIDVYVTESKLPRSFSVPVLETRVIYGRKRKTSSPSERARALGMKKPPKPY